MGLTFKIVPDYLVVSVRQKLVHSVKAIEFAKEHNEFARAFESFPGNADQLFPGWRDKLGVHK